MTVVSRAAEFSENIREMDDEEFAAHRDAVLNEEERRQRLSRAPEQIAAISAAFIADGGDRNSLINAIPTT